MLFYRDDDSGWELIPLKGHRLSHKYGFTHSSEIMLCVHCGNEFESGSVWIRGQVKKALPTKRKID